MPPQDAGAGAPPPVLPAPRPLDVARDALFLDFDGTLVEIAPTPEAVRPAATLVEVLAALERATGGALAIVTGRKLEDIDHFLGPLRLPAAALHGRDRRLADGARERREAPAAALAAAREELGRVVAAHTGAMIEDKGDSLALHYRAVPEAGEAALAAAERVVAASDGALLAVPGKMVVELVPAGETKGTAVEAMMTAAPFAGRTPVFVGDDVTDEAGFAAASQLGGLGIRVGEPKATAATAGVADVPTLHAWLGAALESAR